MTTTRTTCAILMALAFACPASAESITTMVAVAAADGSALGGPMITDTTSHVVSYPLGLTKRDKHGVAVWANQMPPGLGGAAQLLAYDGKLAVFYDWNTNRLSAYTMGTTGFTLAGSCFRILYCDNMGPELVQLTPSAMVISCYERLLFKQKGDAAAKFSISFSVTAYNRTLSKVLWKTPNADDAMVKGAKWLGKDVVTYHTITNVAFYRRGKPLALHTIPSLWRYVPGHDGRMAYFDYGTNPPPVSYCSKKSVVVTNVILTETTNRWVPVWELNRDIFYVVDYTAQKTNTIYAYKLGKSIELINCITNFEYVGEAYAFDGKTFYELCGQFISGQWHIRVVVYSRDLKTQLWSSASSPGRITLLARGVYCRRNEDDTAVSLEVINKQGVIVTHTFPKM